MRLPLYKQYCETQQKRDKTKFSSQVIEKHRILLELQESYISCTLFGLLEVWIIIWPNYRGCAVFRCNLHNNTNVGLSIINPLKVNHRKM